MWLIVRFKGILHRCQAAFKRHSFVGSVLVYSCLYGGGDVARQTMQRTPMDYAMTGRMAVVGGGSLAPFMYAWYRILDKMMPGKTMQVIVKKVVVDQLVACSMGISIFYVGQCLHQILFRLTISKKYPGLRIGLTSCPWLCP